MKSIAEPPVLTVAGDDHARGLKIGAALSKKIGLNIDYYLKMWTETGTPIDEVLDISSRFIPSIKSYAPHIYAEIEGISAGSHRPLEQVVALNCRWELFYINAIKNECTSIGLNSGATAEGHTFLAQNWDYLPGVREGLALIFESQEPERPNLLLHTEAGVVGQKGMNSASMGIVVNGLATYDDHFDTKVPFLVMLREILNQRDIGDVTEVIDKTGRAVSGNVMAAQSQKPIIDVECTADGYSVIKEENGKLNHANTFCSLELKDKVRDKIKDVYPDSMLRQNRSSSLIQMYDKDSNGLEAIQQMLRDHENSPNSICRHLPDQGSRSTDSVTLASMIMDLHEKVLFFANGNPCSTPYRKFVAEEYWR